VKAIIVALVKVGNAIKVGNDNTTSFVGIFLKRSIKVSIYLFEF
jgi:hypothetical protein